MWAIEGRATHTRCTSRTPAGSSWPTRCRRSTAALRFLAPPPAEPKRWHVGVLDSVAHLFGSVAAGQQRRCVPKGRQGEHTPTPTVCRWLTAAAGIFHTDCSCKTRLTKSGHTHHLPCAVHARSFCRQAVCGEKFRLSPLRHRLCPVLAPPSRRRQRLCRVLPLSSPCASAACAAKTPPLPCASTSFAAKAAPCRDLSAFTVCVSFSSKSATAPPPRSYSAR